MANMAIMEIMALMAIMGAKVVRRYNQGTLVRIPIDALAPRTNTKTETGMRFSCIGTNSIVK